MQERGRGVAAGIDVRVDRRRDAWVAAWIFMPICVPNSERSASVEKRK
jgi:hypothetical protein